MEPFTRSSPHLDTAGGGVATRRRTGPDAAPRQVRQRRGGVVGFGHDLGAAIQKKNEDKRLGLTRRTKHGRPSFTDCDCRGRGTRSVPCSAFLSPIDLLLSRERPAPAPRFVLPTSPQVVFGVSVRVGRPASSQHDGCPLLNLTLGFRRCSCTLRSCRPGRIADPSGSRRSTWAATGGKTRLAAKTRSDRPAERERNATPRNQSASKLRCRCSRPQDYAWATSCLLERMFAF